MVQSMRVLRQHEWRCLWYRELRAIDLVEEFKSPNAHVQGRVPLSTGRKATSTICTAAYQNITMSPLGKVQDIYHRLQSINAAGCVPKVVSIGPDSNEHSSCWLSSRKFRTQFMLCKQQTVYAFREGNLASTGRIPSSFTLVMLFIVSSINSFMGLVFNTTMSYMGTVGLVCEYISANSPNNLQVGSAPSQILIKWVMASACFVGHHADRIDCLFHTFTRVSLEFLLKCFPTQDEAQSVVFMDKCIVIHVGMLCSSLYFQMKWKTYCLDRITRMHECMSVCPCMYVLGAILSDSTLWLGVSSYRYDRTCVQQQ